MPRLLQNVNAECQKNVFDAKLCMQQPSLALTLSLTLSSKEHTSFSLIFHLQRLWSLSLRGIWGNFPNPLYSVSFSLESVLHDISPSFTFNKISGISPAPDLHSLGDLHIPPFLTYYYYLKFILYSDFTQFYQMFCCFRIPSRIPH